MEKKPIKAFAGPAKKEGDKVKYDAHFKIEEGFGEVGGVIVTNEHHKEMHLIDIVITGYGNDPINIMCNSWVHAKDDSSQKRIFFTNKVFIFLSHCLLVSITGFCFCVEAHTYFYISPEMCVCVCVFSPTCHQRHRVV